ncbi:MAG TPA: SDR family oxidoreductase [Bacteroidales bacterium]|nr:SDR family oxidoreductase [Bacteroidales bacterium]HPI85289.1 SDR family oxidoreductase [Bacteroidales bacterium]HPM91458.1 SDR family oxidoreductase [Bacteroidales bacterium]
MTPFELTGKTILVTGASSGLGKQCAITASEQGATVIITGRNTERLLETFEKLSGAGHQMFGADLTVQADISALVARLPELNGVVYSTGISDLAPARFVKKEEIDRTFSISYNASVLLTGELLAKKKLAKGACSLVFISTISTKYPFVGGTMYISAKAALESYAKVLALELAPKGIRSNSISPAFVKTPMLDHTAEKYSDEAVRKIEAQQLLGLGEPEDVANVVVFFLSDASRWITASNLILGGG